MPESAGSTHGTSSSYSNASPSDTDAVACRYDKCAGLPYGDTHASHRNADGNAHTAPYRYPYTTPAADRNSHTTPAAHCNTGSPSHIS